MKNETFLQIKTETYKLLVELARRSPLGCNQPEEIDIGEYMACEKCYNCVMRRRLKETGIDELKHLW